MGRGREGEREVEREREREREREWQAGEYLMQDGAPLEQNESL